MALRIGIIIVLAGIVFFVGIPFALRLAGVDVFSSGEPSAGSALLRSDNGGETWNNAALSEEPGVPFSGDIRALVVHPANPGVFIAGTNGSGLWRSENQGLSWRRMVDRTGGLAVNAVVYAIAVHPIESRILYLAAFQQNRGRVLKSENGGETFREVYATTADRAFVFDIAVDAGDPDRVMAVTGQGGIIESRNGGISWRPQRWFGEGLQRLWVNPQDPGERYVMTVSANLWKTVDGGVNWADIPESASRGVVQGIRYPPPNAFNFFGFGGSSGPGSRLAFAVDPRNPSVLYLGGGEGVLRSTDAGQTWTALDLLIPPNSLPIQAVAVNPFDSNMIFAIANGELHMTRDGGANWRATRIPVSGAVRSLFIHPLKPDIMFMAVGR